MGRRIMFLQEIMMGYIYLNIYVYLLIIEISKMGVRVITSMGAV